MSDANKTELTKRVTNAAALWLQERGFRPVESEVTIATGWCADVAGFAYLTRTEAKKLKLLADSPKWNPDDKNGCRERFDAWHQSYGRLPVPVTAAIEVKTSVNDFKRDRKFGWDFLPVHLPFVAMPRGLIEPGKVNPRWGILTFDANDGKLKRIRHAQLQAKSPEDVLRVVCGVAMRRDNHTRYERFREFDRQAREHNNERENRHRISSVIAAVLDIQSGRYGIDEAFAAHGCRCKAIPKHLRDRLQLLVPAQEQIA